MNAPFYKRVEIAFWDFAIHAMSEDEQVRVTIQRIYQVIHYSEIRRLARWMALSAAVGLMSGLCLFVLTETVGR